MAEVDTPLQLNDYLESLPGTTLKKLYQAPSTVLAIYRRMLTPLAKTIITKTLYLDQPLQLKVLDDMIKKEAEGQRDQAVTILRKLHIINITNQTSEKPAEFFITPNFLQSYRLVLEGGGNHNSFGVPSLDPSPKHVTIQFLDEWSTRKLDGILQFVVNSTSVSAAVRVSVGEVVKRLLIHGGLIRVSDAGLRITQAGFTFLLQETNSQVWTLLLMWLKSALDDPNMDSVDMLTFLFMLATLELGHPYDTSALSPSRKNMLPDLVDFGLIYIEKDMPSQYFPTRLATSLTSSQSITMQNQSGIADDIGDEGIIVETNYRLYCRTRSSLQIAILGLFSELKERLATLVTARLTKRSIQQAVDFGITAEQIIRYLSTHAHEQMRKSALAKGRHVLPPTVTDQIRLWQLDRERLGATPGFIFKEFTDKMEYQKCTQYAQETGVLEWKSDEKQTIFVTRHEQLAVYLKLLKKGGA